MKKFLSYIWCMSSRSFKIANWFYIDLEVQSYFKTEVASYYVQKQNLKYYILERYESTHEIVQDKI